jgi:hypothetical protein
MSDGCSTAKRALHIQRNAEGATDMPDPKIDLKKAVENQRKVREAMEKAKAELEAERKRKEAESGTKRP